MKKKTQKERVADILKEQGYIDNLFCVETKLTLRLGAIIHVLRQEGWEFDDARSGFLEGTKNYRYYLSTAPKTYKSVFRLNEETGAMIEERVAFN